MVPSAAAWRYLQRTRSIPSLRGGVMGVHSAFFVSGDLGLWPLHSNSSERGTQHVFPVNLAQIRTAVPEIFHSQTKWKKWKKSQTALKQNPTEFTACGKKTGWFSAASWYRTSCARCQKWCGLGVRSVHAYSPAYRTAAGRTYVSHSTNQFHWPPACTWRPRVSRPRSNRSGRHH